VVLCIQQERNELQIVCL